MIQEAVPYDFSMYCDNFDRNLNDLKECEIYKCNEFAHPNELQRSFKSHLSLPFDKH